MTIRESIIAKSLVIIHGVLSANINLALPLIGLLIDIMSG